jgi:hypothetical protein
MMISCSRGRFLCHLCSIDWPRGEADDWAEPAGNLSAQDWQIMREIVEAVKTALPDAATKPPGEVLEYLRDRLTSNT